MSDVHDPAEDQPLPIDNGFPVVQRLIIEESMTESMEVGYRKYGARGVKPFNGRDPLLDLEQELRDALVYARQLRYERDNPPITDGMEELRTGMASFLSVLEPAYAERSPDQVHDWAVSMVDQYLAKAVSTIRREAFERGSSPAVGALLAEIQNYGPGTQYRKGLERAVELLIESWADSFKVAYEKGVKNGIGQERATQA